MKSRVPHVDDDDAPLYSVTQVADMVGVSAAVLRRWDREGLVSPGRSEGGQRRYSRNEIHQLERAVALAGGGVSAHGIQRMMDMEDRINELEAELSASDSAESGVQRSRGR